METTEESYDVDQMANEIKFELDSFEDILADMTDKYYNELKL